MKTRDRHERLMNIGIDYDDAQKMSRALYNLILDAPSENPTIIPIIDKLSENVKNNIHKIVTDAKQTLSSSFITNWLQSQKIQSFAFDELIAAGATIDFRPIISNNEINGFVPSVIISLLTREDESEIKKRISFQCSMSTLTQLTQDLQEDLDLFNKSIRSLKSKLGEDFVT